MTPWLARTSSSPTHRMPEPRAVPAELRSLVNPRPRHGSQLAGLARKSRLASGPRAPKRLAGGRHIVVCHPTGGRAAANSWRLRRKLPRHPALAARGPSHGQEPGGGYRRALRAYEQARTNRSRKWTQRMKALMAALAVTSSFVGTGGWDDRAAILCDRLPGTDRGPGPATRWRHGRTRG